MQSLIEEKQRELKQLMALQNVEELKKEFLDAFKKMVEHIKKMEEELSEKVESKTQSAIAELQETVKKIEDDNTSSFSNIKKWAIEAVNKFVVNSKINEKLGEVEEKLAELKTFELPDASSIALEASKMAQDGLLPLIPIVDKLEEKLPEMGIPIRDALERLDEEEKLKIEAIKNLREELDELKKSVEQKGKGMSVIGHSSGGGRIVKSYDISSSLNGTTKTFTLPYFWRIISVHLSSFPNVLRETTDYTSSASAYTITFTDQIDAGTSLASGQTCVVIYSE